MRSGSPPEGPERVKRHSRRSGSGWLDLLKVRERLGVPPGGSGRGCEVFWRFRTLGGPVGSPKEVERPSPRSGRCWEALPKVWEGSAGRPRGLKGVGSSGRGREILLKGREALPEGREGSRGQGGVRRPFWRSRSDRESLPKVREALSRVRERSGGSPNGPGGPHRGPVGVAWPSQTFERGWEILPVGRYGSGGPPGPLGGIERPCRRTREG